MHGRGVRGALSRRVHEGLEWRWRRARRYWYLLTSFRNGLAMARSYGAGDAIDRAIRWDGTTLDHPANRSGLVETLIEIWSDCVYTGGFYRPAPGDVVIDAGANVGLFAVPFARKFRDCRIIAFEPFPENFQLLRRNIESAHVSTIEAHQAALGGTSGVGHMHDGGARSLDHRLTHDTTTPSLAAVAVHDLADAIRLASANRIALFKIDIEGSEAELFDHADQSDLARVDRFAIEYHDHMRSGTSTMLRDRLSRTHSVDLRPTGRGYGMIYAARRGLGGPL